MAKLYRVLILLGIFLGLGISCASAANVVTFDPQTVEVYPGSSQDVQIVMDEVPDGLAGFKITISILDPEIAEITAVSFPSWNTMPESSTIPSSSVWIKALDPLKKVNPGDTNVLLGTITITGKKAGTTDLSIPETKISADGGSLITPVVITGSVHVLDDEAPVINSVSLSSTAPNTGASIVVTVDVTDNVGVSSVEASGVAFANTGGNVWKGNLVALEGTHSVTVSAMDEAGNVARDTSISYTTTLAPDYLPPSSITNLQSTKGTTWIKWTWQNPTDTDFAHTEVYLNGAYQPETSAEYFNATGLESETSYTIGTRTVDINGNMNETWINQTAITEKEFVPEIKLPVANFTANVSEGYVPLSVQFTDLSENAVSFNWDFGDGTINSKLQNPTHTYFTAGIYAVNLTVTNENGTDSKLATINVSETSVSVLPVANFTANVTEGYVPLSVQFTDLSENAVSFDWDFGDGANSTDKNPIHTYFTAGIYAVNLTVSNGNDTDSKLATINVSETSVSVLPVANFTTNVSEGYAPLSVQFNDSSENAVSFDWDFGDGANSTQQNPTHTYLFAGNYTVNLTVSNGNDTDSKLATINVSEKTVPDDNDTDEGDGTDNDCDNGADDVTDEVCEDPTPVCEPTPVCKPTPVCEPTPVCKPTPVCEPTPVCKPTPVCEVIKPVCTETKPVCVETKPVCTETKPVSCPDDKKPEVDTSCPDDKKPEVDTSCPDEKPKVDTSCPDEKPKVDTSCPAEKPKVDTSCPAEKPKVDTSCPDEKPKVDTSCPAEKPKVDTSCPAEKPAVDTSCPAEKPAVDTSCPAEKPAVGTCPDDEKPAVGPGPDDEKPKVDTSCPDEKPAVGPGPDDEKPAVGTCPDDEKPAVGTCPDDEKPAVGPGPDDEKPAVGPGPDDEKPAVGPGPDDEKPSCPDDEKI